MGSAKSYGPLLACAAAVAALGVAHGWWTDRWGPSERLQHSVAALDRVPSEFGDWVGEDAPYPIEEVKRAGIRGCVFRKYQNAHTGEVVSALLVCGRGGPISVHTPDVCYAGAGYRAASEESSRSFTAGETDHSFRVTRFAKPDGTAQGQLEVCWAWSVDGRRWEGADAGQARLTLGRSPAVYKLYVVREFVPGTRAEAADPCGDFLRRALPDLAALASEG
jgi:hypothetical protein